MQYRPLGRTGLNVSELSFGASSLGAAFHPINEADAIRAVHVSIDRGINFIDVSPFYGLTTAETMLGRALILWRPVSICQTPGSRWKAFARTPVRLTRWLVFMTRLIAILLVGAAASAASGPMQPPRSESTSIAALEQAAREVAA